MKKTAAIVLLCCSVLCFPSCDRKYVPQGDYMTASLDSYSFQGDSDNGLTYLGGENGALFETTSYYKVNRLLETEWLVRRDVFSLFLSDPSYILLKSKNLAYDPILDWPVSSLVFVETVKRSELALSQALAEQLLALVREAAGWEEAHCLPEEDRIGNREFRVYFEDQDCLFWYGWIQVGQDGEQIICRYLEGRKVGKKIPEALAEELSLFGATFQPQGEFVNVSCDSYLVENRTGSGLACLGYSGGLLGIEYYQIKGLPEGEWLAERKGKGTYILLKSKDLSDDPILDWPVSSLVFVSEGREKPKIVLSQTLMEELLALVRDTGGWEEASCLPETDQVDSREFRVYFEDQKCLLWYGWIQVGQDGEPIICRYLEGSKVGKKIPEALAEELALLVFAPQQ